SASDYRLDTLQLSIPPGALEAAFTLEALADSLDEADESLTLSLSGLENAVAGVPAALEVVVVDATPPTAAFVLAAQTVDEDAGTVELRVRLSSPSREAVSLPFSLGGEALAGEDVIVSASPLVIAAGQTEGRITLNVVDDSLDEINERLILTLGSPQGALLGSPQVHSLTLRDDDAAPLLSFARSDSRVAEGGELAIELLLSAASGQTIEANLAVGGTADGEDYGLSPLPLRIAPGTLSARLVLNALADSRREGSETVTLSLQDASGAVLRDPTLHTVTVDDSTRASGDDDDGGGSLGLGLLGLLGLAAVRRRVAATMGA
ncbi:MAG TPA: Calx-beta domain-containing protein, partial [Nevskiaceae bacterium]|nr:Calx-beta domain-containing protein [Nevskiaceae bacterium]